MGTDKNIKLHIVTDIKKIMALLRKIICVPGRPFFPRISIKIRSCLFSTDALDNELNLEYLDGDRKGIVVMSINRPAAKNALSKNLGRLLECHMDTLSNDSTSRVLILRSAVPKIFCAGADLKERKLMKEEDVPVFVSNARMLFHRLSGLRFQQYVHWTVLH